MIKNQINQFNPGLTQFSPNRGFSPTRVKPGLNLGLTQGQVKPANPAQYPVRWTAQSALHFFPPLADMFIPTPTRLLREAFCVCVCVCVWACVRAYVCTYVCICMF